MKKALVVLLVVVAISLGSWGNFGATPSVAAENDTTTKVGNWYFGVFGGIDNGGGALSLQRWNENFKFTAPMDSGIVFGFKYGYIPVATKGYFATELEHVCSLVKFSNGVNSKTTGTPGKYTNRYTSGDIASYGIFANALLRYPDGRFHPYIGAGLGYFSTFFSEPYGVYSYDEFVTTGLIVKPIVGIEVDVTSGISLEARYTFYKTTLDFTPTFVGWSEKYNIENDSNIFTLGVNYHF